MEHIKQSILIVDDTAFNRSFLRDMLEDEYIIIDAEDGAQALECLQQNPQIALVLLDIIMPRMDGFTVLQEMSRRGLLENTPTVIISGETSPDMISKAYDLGAIDYISRPFDIKIVKRRVKNTIMLYAKQKTLQHLVEQQVRAREQDNSQMIDILSTIVEFRNGESGPHVLRIRFITKLLLHAITRMFPEYMLTAQQIQEISIAAALHDVGKIAVPEHILNKPAKLTQEEFEIIKTHSAYGEQMLKNVTIGKDSAMLQYARRICRWHHERWDGRGYPDGLRGNEIPLCAQVVALADVYDALVSKRVYKPAYSAEKAVEMILNGECGAFNPQLLQVLRAESRHLQNALAGEQWERVISDSPAGALVSSEYTGQDAIMLLEQERIKYQFLAELACDIMFDYDMQTDTIQFSGMDVLQLGLPPILYNWRQNSKVQTLLSQEDCKELAQHIRATSPQQPIYHEQYLLHPENQSPRWYDLTVRTLWSNHLQPRCIGCIGTMTDVHVDKMEINRLRDMAEHDSLTGLFNHAAAQQRINEFIEGKEEKSGVLIFFDVDYFKLVNDNCGHPFGDQLLQHIAQIVRMRIRHTDIAARVGGDEFIIFLHDIRDEDAARHQTQRILNGMRLPWKGFCFSVSIGCAMFPQDAENYQGLLKCADAALYHSKREGRDCITFYEKDKVALLDNTTCLSQPESEARLTAEREMDETT